MKYPLGLIRELEEGAEADGMPGLLRAVARMIDPEGPSAECIQAADEGMDSAATNGAGPNQIGDEQYYEAALGMATCLRQSVVEPEPVEPDPGEPEEPESDKPEPRPGNLDVLGDLVLAALLAHMRRRYKT